MKKSALILALGILVLSCSKKETQIQTNTSDSLSADTMTSATVPQDTMSVSTITDSSSMPKDSTSTTRK
ncbi:hypothetical protein OF897_13265 [Chryseobacterium formosus]|uniref:Cytochrome C551 n=1 Tax=Chryseobacterium formosus TaxID=1537363 RepID=A0ABT3XRY2_9FLAO|nr:hypothetical protein [Chryseobacterium formosus]MCX8524883.1 hypothetical protein [Chryseobacterium formosus]